MGRVDGRSGLGDALFTPVQQRVLGLLFGQPERRYQSAELIRLARGGVGATHRQLARLVSSGLAKVSPVGNQKYYQANRDSPVFRELRSLVVKTIGLAEPLKRALAPLARSITVAFVYGSVARGTDKAQSDVDVLVVSESLSYAEVFEALQAAEADLGRSINPTVLSPAQWRAKKARGDSFVGRIARKPRVFLIGSDDALR